MFYRVAFLVLMILASACSLPPPLPSESRVSISEVVDRVQCELATAVKPYLNKEDHKWIKNWAAAYSLTLKVEDEGALVASSDIIQNPGTLTLSVNAGITRTATRTATLEFSLYVSELEDYECLPSDRPKGRYFSNDTGLMEWLDRIMGSMDKKDKVHVPSKFGHILDFTIKANAGAGPAWVFERYKPKGSLSGSRKDTHTLGIAFNKRAGDPDACGEKVQVTNFPEWMRNPPPGFKAPTKKKEEMTAQERKAEDEKKKEEWDKLVQECRDRWWGGEKTPPAKKGRSRFSPVDSATQFLLDQNLYTLQLQSRNFLILP